MALAYLLARASDTVADSAGVPASERLALLEDLGRAIKADSSSGKEIPEGLSERLGALAGHVDDPGERRLLRQGGALLDLLDRLIPADRADVSWVLAIIFSGQRLDLERFEAASAERPVALANAAELNDYTYRVAGCVGVFWTRICFRHLAGYAAMDEPEMIRLGSGFGNGLQLVNILRDAPRDLAEGRCYLPAEELAGEGSAPELLKSAPERARPVVARWIGCARQHLEDGRAYIEALRPWRLRLACFLPWAIGNETLAMLERISPLETPRRLKIPRRRVRQLLLWGCLVAFSNRFLSRFISTIKKRD